MSLSYLDCEIRLPLMKLPVRSTVVSVAGARLLISPGSTLKREQLLAAGPITDLVVTNFLHSGGVLKALEVFPEARVWGPKGIRAHKPQIPWTHEIQAESWPYQGELSVIPVRGMPAVREQVFLHHPSKTLIVTDLAFNLVRPKGLLSWVFLKAFGTYKRFAISRFFLGAVKKEDEFKASLREILSHDFDRLVMSHGEVLERGAKEKFQLALQERGY